MNALMPSGQLLTMTSREIADLTQKRHDHVMADCRKLADFYSETYSPEKSGQLVKTSTYVDSTGRVLPCFEMDKQASLDLVTGYSLPHRHAVNKRWQELEGQKPEPVELSRMDILQLAVQAEQARIEAEKQLALAAPKVDYVNRYVAAEGAIGFRQLAKTLGANEHQLSAWLQDKKIMYRLDGKLTPYQCHISAGRFTVKTGVNQLTDKAFVQARFTPKGVEWIAGEWGKHQLSLVTEGKAVTA